MTNYFSPVLDSDSKSDQFNPFYLVIDDVDDKRAASVNALDDLAMPSSNTQSSNNDKLKKESTLSAPADNPDDPDDTYADIPDDGFLIRSDKWMADSNQIGYNGDGYSLIETLSLTSLLSNSQYAITTNQKIIDQSSQANDSQLINLFINECKTLFIRIRKPTPQLVLALNVVGFQYEELNFMIPV
uniref:Uncharacterized protein n=1 Tax=Rhizophagus irregularis (strain DAOM 181602 / DAOM 197198 / MUCL 43194) TaxID=747089 RepID=U9T3G0_RHIID